MKTTLKTVQVTAILLALVSAAYADSWDVSTGYSGSSNPNGPWSFGWKSSATATGMGLLTVRWGNGGWYKAGTDGDPSMQPGPLLWANANGNGLPNIRWTCPQPGYYDVNGSFAGADSRGENVNVYVSVNGSITYSSTLAAYQQEAPFTNNLAFLNPGDFVDFTIAWDGAGIAGTANWTSLAAIIFTDPAPQTATATATMTNGFVVGANLTYGGQGYTNTPVVRFIGGGGAGAEAEAVVSNGVVTAVNILNPGAGYTSAPIMVVEPPFILNPGLSITPLTYLAFSNLSTGGVYQLQMSEGYYWSNQPVSFTATNTVYSQTVAGVASSGDYQLALTPLPGQAFATAQVVNGFVVGITLTSGGSGYATNPAVSIVGSGSNAVAVASIFGGVVTNIAVVDPGIGYTNGTLVEIAPPPTAALSPTTVLPMVQLDATSLAPYDNYQIQFTPALGETWANWAGGSFTPTSATNSQLFFFTNSAGFFRLKYLP